MRLDWLKIRTFKNLQDVEINFDEGELSTVLIGENGTGKSNVIEAIVTIFRDLDLGDSTVFPYSIAYNCYGHRIEIDNAYSGKNLAFSVDGKPLSRASFFDRRSEFLPANVFGYYSGASRRLEQLFDKHQVRYYKKVISPESSAKDIQDVDLRRLFYCRPAYGQLALLSYFAFGADSAKSFLKKHMGISGFDGALIVLRKPRWAGTKPTKHQLNHGDPRFWYSAGLVRGLLEKLWEQSLAPITDQNREQDDYRAKASSEEQVYIFIKDAASLRQIAKSFGDEKTFFALLETLDISDLIREVRIWVEKTGVEGEIPFHEISDGEKQLLSVLGLMRFTGRDESLFLLDEPDTHLNPAWKWDYLQLVKDVAQKNGESHIIMTSHDPLTMASLKASQVQVMSVSKDGKLSVQPPDVDPRGLGFTGILTQIFGLPTTVDPDTQKRLDERNELLRIDKRTKAQEVRLIKLSEELKRLGFMIEDREPEYELFLRALQEIKAERRTVFSPEMIAQKNEVAKRMLAEIMSRKENRQ
ncbi:MAG: AAA family ATPase [Mesorhizobium sp.]|uniref:AAA family ATPase n=1 Tax=Mesorhizobium sp. TaxID=1871066 RepID=UPI000FE64F7D|nr:AAA family ATPase [Mesorhizobium sp.]RWI18632.1 MAG: AAA family ATPase [Mesorhizobium sp.]RWK93390.1 MAG: AAA family ATPase [Mesorhizobium sp.]